jgi:hypothetical protein
VYHIPLAISRLNCQTFRRVLDTFQYHRFAEQFVSFKQRRRDPLPGGCHPQRAEQLLWLQTQFVGQPTQRRILAVMADIV